MLTDAKHDTNAVCNIQVSDITREFEYLATRNIFPVFSGDDSSPDHSSNERGRARYTDGSDRLRVATDQMDVFIIEDLCGKSCFPAIAASDRRLWDC